MEDKPESPPPEKLPPESSPPEEPSEKQQEESEQPKPRNEKRTLLIQAAIAFLVSLWCIKDGWIKPIDAFWFNRLVAVVAMVLAIYWFVRALRYKGPPSTDQSESTEEPESEDRD